MNYGTLSQDQCIEKIKEEFDRVMLNCAYYEREGKMMHLLNEIGTLRGIAYALKAIDYDAVTGDFLRFIEIQNQMLKVDK